ncbi:PREDICTED: glutamate-gated chloride channel-like [Nicrophorus vespilloides]|uniref:Glutamate-gated chloride channel-like n=1 Tax=Nicrophorus vespilloides TaxID=110193 RepID=A0ABM1NJ59_NICVS|nr:PREDICTED: glutamate-gated chloride channel-like [Nicrophorus vespilloides]
MFSVKTVLLLLSATLCAEATIYQRKQEKQILDNILSVNYDSRIRPPSNATNGPIDVTVNIAVMKITSVDDESMLFSMDIRFRQEWKDDRLKYATSNALKYITLDDDEYIWTPDLFFNEYKAYAHDTTRPNILLRIYADGSVLLSKRYVEKKLEKLLFASLQQQQ